MIAAVAGRQHNRISRAQLEALGCSSGAIKHRVAGGRLTLTEEGVFGVAPVLDDPWGRWMGATLTAPGTFLAFESAAVALRWLDHERELITVVRRGNGGPRRHGGILEYRRPIWPEETTTLRAVPITRPERTLLDLAPILSQAALARALRQAVRLRHTTLAGVAEFANRHPARWGRRKLMRAVARHAGLPIERARSGAEIQALIVLRNAGVELPELNVKVAGLEADLVWRRHRLIVEIDGGPFHQDVGEDYRKEAIWRAAGQTVLRIPSHHVHEHPARLIALAPTAPFRPTAGA